ncbi:MAG: hypothetical protein D6820_15940 [Lentisphaerae bacterium]|nr:MAG: hypothetical protein D6820_15940 [Lentisphaerota bacterium]
MKNSALNLFSFLLPAMLLLLLSSCSKKEATPQESLVPEDEIPAPVMAQTFVIEAENPFHREGHFELIEDEMASGKKALKVPGKMQCTIAGSNEPPLKPEGKLVYTWTLNQPAKLKLWLRVKWAGSCANSFSVILPNGKKHTVTSSTYNAWIWLPAGPITEYSQGPCSITILPREFDAAIDQILLTNDDDYTPQNIETSNLKDQELFQKP